MREAPRRGTAISRYLADYLSINNAHFVPGEGSLRRYHHWRDTLEQIVESF